MDERVGRVRGQRVDYGTLGDNGVDGMTNDGRERTRNERVNGV